MVMIHDVGDDRVHRCSYSTRPSLDNGKLTLKVIHKTHASNSKVMEVAWSLLFICFLQLNNIDGCLAVSWNLEEDYDYNEQDTVTDKDVFILKNRATNSCLDIPWSDFDRALDEFTPVKTYRNCHGGRNQLFQLRQGFVVSYPVPCLGLGVPYHIDGDPIGLVLVGDDDILSWALDAGGDPYVYPSLRIGVKTHGGNVTLMRRQTLDDPRVLTLEKVRGLITIKIYASLNILNQHLTH